MKWLAIAVFTALVMGAIYVQEKDLEKQQEVMEAAP